MQDMLVALHNTPAADVIRLVADFIIRRGASTDATDVRALIEREFAASWLGVAEGGFGKEPINAWVALRGDELIGFAVWDLAYRGYFGPIGVAEQHRGNGIGAALLLHALDSMRAAGYAYAIIGKVGPAEFYGKVCGATLIAGEPAP